MTYRESIDRVIEQLSTLKDKHRISPSESSWVYEAIDYTKKLMQAENDGISQSDYFAKEEFLYDKTVTSLVELINLRNILNSVNTINNDNLNIYLQKLKVVFNTPLLIKDETINSAHGRNTMFELRLFSNFIESEYDAFLSYDNPDITIQTNGNNYFIECKRIFKKETLIKNAKDAIDQLIKYSLNKPGYGIVAISVTRYFHAGDKRLEANSEYNAKKRIEYEMDELLKENGKELFNLFPFKIPALLLEFSDRAIIDKVYNMNLIYIVDTADGRASMFYKPFKDLRKLTGIY